MFLPPIIVCIYICLGCCTYLSSCTARLQPQHACHTRQFLEWLFTLCQGDLIVQAAVNMLAACTPCTCVLDFLHAELLSFGSAGLFDVCALPSCQLAFLQLRLQAYGIVIQVHTACVDMSLMRQEHGQHCIMQLNFWNYGDEMGMLIWRPCHTSGCLSSSVGTHIVSTSPFTFTCREKSMQLTRRTIDYGLYIAMLMRRSSPLYPPCAVQEGLPAGAE